MIPAPALTAQLAGKLLLIFDFDGTIADSSPLHEQAFREVLRPHEIEVDYPRIAGRATRDAMRLCYTLSGKAEPEAGLLNDLVEQKQRRGRELLSSSLMAFPAAEALLNWARPRFRLALVSSGSRATIDISLAKLGMSDWFEYLITADDVSAAKPDPQGFLMALNRTGVEADAALIFEDAESGFEAARRAGVDVVDARQLAELVIEG